MTGATIDVTFDDAEFRARLGKLTGLTKDFRPLLQRIGVGLVETTLHRFETATDPWGRAWKALTPAYAKRKKGPGILREKAMRGGLMGSITYQLASAESVSVGSNKAYAAIHQFGGTFKREARTIRVFRFVSGEGRVLRFGQFQKQKLSNFGSQHSVGEHTMTMPARPYLGFGPADREAALEAVAFTLSKLLYSDAS